MQKISGSKNEERINKAKQWYKEKLAEGWHYTVVGFLSPEEIERAGLNWNKDKIQKWSEELKKDVLVERGYDSVPVEEYMEEHGEPGRSKGTKYYGASRQFLEWYQTKKSIIGRKNIDDYVNEDMIKKAIPITNDNINIDDIKF